MDEETLDSDSVLTADIVVRHHALKRPRFDAASFWATKTWPLTNSPQPVPTPGCLGFGGFFLGVGIVVMLAGGAWGIVIAAVGQASLLVGLVGFAVKLGVEAAARPMSDSSRSD